MFEAIVNHLDAADRAVLKAHTIAANAEGLPVDATREILHALVRDAHREIIAVYKMLGVNPMVRTGDGSSVEDAPVKEPVLTA